MCYNYNNFIKDEDGQLVNKYKLSLTERTKKLQRQADWDKFKERYKFFYTTGFDHKHLPVITMEKPDEVQFYSWGLIPHWVKSKEEAKERSQGNLNAKSETIFDLPSFRSYIKTQRCLIPATGFYEWLDISKKKFPFNIIVRDEDSPECIRDFCFGGIYSHWTDKETGEVVSSFAIITTPANEMMERIHNLKKRMPFILKKEDEALWLRNDLDETEIMEMMQPYPSRLMTAYTIGKLLTARGIDRNVEEVLREESYAEVDKMIHENI